MISYLLRLQPLFSPFYVADASDADVIFRRLDIDATLFSPFHAYAFIFFITVYAAAAERWRVVYAMLRFSPPIHTCYAMLFDDYSVSLRRL